MEVFDKKGCDILELSLKEFLVHSFPSIATGNVLTDLLEIVPSHCLYRFEVSLVAFGALERPRLPLYSGREPRLWNAPLALKW